MVFFHTKVWFALGLARALLVPSPRVAISRCRGSFHSNSLERPRWSSSHTGSTVVLNAWRLPSALSSGENEKKKRFRMLKWTGIVLAVVAGPAFASSAVASQKTSGVGTALRAVFAGVAVWFSLRFIQQRTNNSEKNKIAAFRSSYTSNQKASSLLAAAASAGEEGNSILASTATLEPPPSALKEDDLRRAENDASREKAGRLRAEQIATEAPARTEEPVTTTSSSKKKASSVIRNPFKKKPERAIELEALLKSEELPIETREFGTSVAGYLCAMLLEEGVSDTLDDFALSLTTPWTDRKLRAAREARERALRAWKDRASAASHFDFGVRETTISRQFDQPTVERWRQFCDRYYVISYRDAGAVDVDDSARTLQNIYLDANMDAKAAADIFANVVNALLIPPVDAAVKLLKRPNEQECLLPLASVARIATFGAQLYEKLGLPILDKPVIYEGKASRGQLQALFARYAATAIAQGLKEEDSSQETAIDLLPIELDVAAVDILQTIFGISDRRAQKLADQVVKQLVASMMGDAGGAFGGSPAAPGDALNGQAAPNIGDLLNDPKGMPSEAEIDRQLDDLQVALDSGALSNADKQQIKETFQQMLGTSDFNNALQAAEANKEQLDPRSKKALDLLRKLM